MSTDIVLSPGNHGRHPKWHRFSQVQACGRIWTYTRYSIIHKSNAKACSLTAASQETSERAERGSTIVIVTQVLFLMETGRMAYLFCIHKVGILRVGMAGPSSGSGHRKMQQLWRWDQRRTQRGHDTWLQCSFDTRSMSVGYGQHRNHSNGVLRRRWGRKPL